MKKRMKRITATLRNGCFEKMAPPSLFNNSVHTVFYIYILHMFGRYTHEALVGVGELVTGCSSHHHLSCLLAGGQVDLHRKQTPLSLTRFLGLNISSTVYQIVDEEIE